MVIHRGDVFLVDFNPTKGSEQSGIRPALIVQNNVGNYYSPTTIVVPLSTKISEKNYPTDVRFEGHEVALEKSGVIKCDQMTIGALPL